MIKNILVLLITYIGVFCAFDIAEAFLLPVDYWTHTQIPLYMMLSFSLFLTVVLRYVKKAGRKTAYWLYIILFSVSVLMYKFTTIWLLHIYESHW